MAGNWKQRVDQCRSSPVLGRWFEVRRLLAHHDGHVRHKQVLVEPGTDGSSPEDVGRGECGDLVPVWCVRRVCCRTWLCGGRIVVARDSFVAHAFRSKFPYKVNGADVLTNYIRIANVWLDEKHLSLFYNASRIKLINGKPKQNYGDITGTLFRLVVSAVERLELKNRLHCKPFSWYAEKFDGRALCLPSL